MKENAIGGMPPPEDILREEISHKEGREITTRKVTLELVPPKQETLGTMRFEEYRILNERGEGIGKRVLVVSVPPGREHTAYLNTINLQTNEDPEKNFKGKGYGMATYLQIIKNLKERGIRFTSSTSQLSKDTYLLWERLVTAGLAKKVREGSFDEDSPEAGYTDSEYEAI